MRHDHVTFEEKKDVFRGHEEKKKMYFLESENEMRVFHDRIEFFATHEVI
jgi:hypothetical protein